MVAATIAAVAASLGAASSIYGTATQDRSGTARQGQLTQIGLDDARATELYNQLVSAMINQRSVAGTEDAYGSTTKYDPATNTWRSTLGELPLAADTASQQAGIRANTTTARAIEDANQQAALRAARYGPTADTAQRNLANYRPLGRDQLVGLLQKQATTSARETFDPIVQSTLTNYLRADNDPGAALAKLGSTQADNLRKSLTDIQVSGMQNVDQINASNRSGLESAATSTNALATPTFQSSNVSASGNNKALTDALASRIYSSATSPAYGTSGVNTSAKNTQDAIKSAVTTAGIVPSQPGVAIGQELSKLGENKYLQDAVKGWFSGGGGTTTQANTYANEDRVLNTGIY